MSGITIVPDSGTQFASGAAQYNSVDRLDDNNFIVAFSDNTDGNEGKVNVGSRTGTAISIDELNAVTFNNDSTSNITVRALTSTLFVISYTEVNSQRYYVRAGTISGVVITLGTPFQVGGQTVSWWSFVAPLDSTNFVVSVGTNEFNLLRTYVGSIAGTTITLGAAQDRTTGFSGGVQTLANVKLDATHFALLSLINGYAILQLTIASVNTALKTITWGDVVNLDNNTTENSLLISTFSEQSVLMGRQLTTAGGTDLYINVATINLSALSVAAVGSEISTGSFTTNKSNYSLTTISELNFLVSWYTTTGTEGELRSGTLSGATTLAWDAQGPVIFDNGASAYTTLCALTDSYFLLGYKAG